MKVKEWLPVWLENYVKPTAKEKTYTRYSEVVTHHLIPCIGELGMSEVTPLTLQQMVTELSAHGNLRTGGGLSANTVNAIVTVIQAALQVAYRLGYLPEYTADQVKRPKAAEKQIECFTVEEQKKIEEAALADRRLKMFGIVLCLYTGLRIGELLALEWSDIDFAKGEISVNKSCHDSKKTADTAALSKHRKRRPPVVLFPSQNNYCRFCESKRKSPPPHLLSERTRCKRCALINTVSVYYSVASAFRIAGFTPCGIPLPPARWSVAWMSNAVGNPWSQEPDGHAEPPCSQPYAA